MGLRQLFRKNNMPMLKKLLSTGVAAVMLLAASAQSKIDPAGLLKTEEYKALVSSGENDGPYRPLNKIAPEIISVFVTMEQDYGVNDLGVDYVEVVSHIDNIFVVRIPVDRLEELAAFPMVKSIETGVRLEPMLDYARPASNVESVQSGFSYDGQQKTFDGSGVICGMMDTGLEANHINFKNTDGTSRIKRLWYMYSDDGSSREYTDETISQFTTDNTSEGHATHVAGIIGGGYKSNGNFLKLTTASGNSGSMLSDQPIPYYGVATGADLAFSVGELYTPNIVQGVANIMDYAESVGKPVVVNLSLGHTSGPHDGTDAYSQSLSKLGAKGIICMSAGNDGDANISITKKFSSTATGKVLNTFIAESEANGIVDIWASNDKTLTVKWGIYDKDKQTTTYFIESTGSGSKSSSGTDFTTYFNGSITTIANLDVTNNRYQVYNRLSGVSMKAGNTSRYLVLSVTGTSGQTVYVYGGTNVVFSNKYSASAGLLSGYTNGSPSNSINDGACAENVISVGAYTTRTTWGRLNGDVYRYTSSDYSVGSISPFSSYGTTFQGVKLPLICAPGANIISSYSSYYAGSNASTTMCASAKSGGKTYYWGAMQGTSMSCPYVTGTIGLWLQADPTLDYEKVMEVINNTSSKVLINSARWGAGKIDALEGIKYVLENKAGIGEVWADPEQRFILTATADGYEAFIAGATGVRVNVYDLQGRRVTDAAANSDRVDVTTAPLTPGVYILEATAADGQRFTRKITR